MKKIKKPIHKSSLQDYEGEIKLSETNNTIDYSLLTAKTLSGKEDYRIVFDTCFFSKDIFTGNKFLKSEFIDCIFDTCDLSNNTFTDCTFIRCEFKNCKFIGTKFVETSLRDVMINDSICEYLDVSGSKLNIVAIQNTSLKDSNWFENELIDTIFDNDNFSKSYIYNTSLKGIDLSTSVLQDLVIDSLSVKGVTIASWQAEVFCKLLEIKIKN